MPSRPLFIWGSLFRWGLLRVPIHKGHDLGAGAGGSGAKAVAASAGGDALGHGPRHSVSIGAYSSHWLSRWYIPTLVRVKNHLLTTSAT